MNSVCTSKTKQKKKKKKKKTTEIGETFNSLTSDEIEQNDIYVISIGHTWNGDKVSTNVSVYQSHHNAFNSVLQDKTRKKNQ